MKSTDSLNFYEIGEIPGICGNPSFAQLYDYTDEAPEYNKRNYYRLTLGLSGYSEIVSAEVIKVSIYGYNIRPHPVVENSFIYFTNPLKKQHFLKIYNYFGSDLFNLSSTNNYFILNNNDFNPGYHLFIITDNNNIPVIRGKFLVY